MQIRSVHRAQATEKGEREREGGEKGRASEVGEDWSTSWSLSSRQRRPARCQPCNRLSARPRPSARAGRTSLTRFVVPPRRAATPQNYNGFFLVHCIAFHEQFKPIAWRSLRVSLCRAQHGPALYKLILNNSLLSPSAGEMGCNC